MDIEKMLNRFESRMAARGQEDKNGHTNPALKTLDAFAGSLVDRIRLARMEGMTFHNQRDLYEVLGYERQISTRQYHERYYRGGIAGRIVDAFPNATWRGGFEVIEDENPKKNTTFEQAWIDLEQKHQITAKLRRVDKVAGLSTFAILLIGATGDLHDELPKGKPEQLLYFTPFSGAGGPSSSNQRAGMYADSDATIHEYDTNTESPRFGLPLFYRLRRVDISSANLQVPVHWTRCIHIAEDVLEDEVFGQPTLERVWNLLDDLAKVTGGGAEAFWLRANQGLHANIDKDLGFAPGEEQKALDALKEQSELYKHQLTRWLKTRGVDVNVLGSDVANFESPADAILTQIAGARGIPKRVLTGSEMGELASSQDRDNWKDQIAGRQQSYAEPYILRPLVDRLIDYGYLPTPKKGARVYEIRWSIIETLTETEKTAGAKSWAETKTADGKAVFLSEEIRDKWYGLEPLTPEQLEAAGPPPKEEPAEKEIEDEEKEEEEKDKDEETDDEEEDEEKEKKPPKKYPRAAEYRAADFKPGREFASTEVRLPRLHAQRLLNIGLNIPDEDLADDGREGTPHITVKYGIHDNDPGPVQEALSDFAGPVKVVFGKTKHFEGDEYDVVFVDVISPDLHKLNKIVSSNVDVTDTFPKYRPHATVAYVKPGLGKKYSGDTAMDGQSTEINAVVFSPTDGDYDVIDLPLVAAEATDEELIALIRDAIVVGDPEILEEIIALGGKGSGNYGHGGRPGVVGGSSSESGVGGFGATATIQRADEDAIRAGKKASADGFVDDHEKAAKLFTHVSELYQQVGDEDTAKLRAKSARWHTGEAKYGMRKVEQYIDAAEAAKKRGDTAAEKRNRENAQYLQSGKGKIVIK